MRKQHERIGRRLEKGYAGRTAEASSELAKHFQGGRDQRRSLVYLEQAAMCAYERRGYREVITCLEPALRLLGDRADTPERARDELRLRRLYSVVLSQTEGFAAHALLENLERTQILSERLADTSAHFDSLGAACLLNANAGDLTRAAEIAGRLPGLAERLDASAVLQSCFMQGAVSMWRGNLGAAGPLLARALASPAALEAADRPYGVNPVVSARSFEGLRRWLVGDSAGAHAVQQEALAMAERNGRPFTLAHAVMFRAYLLLLEEDWKEAGRLATRGAELSEEYGFPLWRGTALVVLGAVLVEEGERARGLAQIEEGIASRRSKGLCLGNSLLSRFAPGRTCERPASRRGSPPPTRA